MNDNILIRANYNAAYRSITVDYMLDGSAEFVARGEFSDAEIDAFIAAEGADVEGFHCAIAL